MKKNKMLQTHLWDTYEVLQARCPYCRKEIEVEYVCGCIDDRETCPSCNQVFILGKQR
jgi:NAD-dependent SIR2 family protein deacetylase